MSATDESQNLDAGWDDDTNDEPDAADVDEAWDSIAPSAVSAAAPSKPPVTEEVDSGWDDVPDAAPAQSGKRRPHRQRRAKANAVLTSTSPVLLPRPAEPTKKHSRDHSRKQRAYEAQVKAQRKEQRKQQRAAEARAEAAERLRQAEAEQAARKARREARQQARNERPSPKPAARPPAATTKRPKPSAVEVKAPAVATPVPAAKRGPRLGVLITLAVLAVVLALVLFNK
jgi:hypothetical protein